MQRLKEQRRECGSVSCSVYWLAAGRRCGGSSADSDGKGLVTVDNTIFLATNRAVYCSNYNTLYNVILSLRPPTNLLAKGLRCA